MSPELTPYIQYPCLELIGCYRQGGFHPIHIDDILQNRYRVVNKLGHGSYATIWLVEDLDSGRYVALKVLSAKASKESSEVAIHRHLKQRQINGDQVSNGQEFLIEFLDDFEVEGPNGTHQCIVTEVLGPCIGTDVEEIYGEERYPIAIAKKIAAQVMRGVAYLHECGVVHGDLHLGNILLRIPGIEQMSHQDLQKYLGEPHKRPLERWDGESVMPSPHLPKYVVMDPKYWELLSLCLSSPEAVHIKICDFGEGFLWDDKPVITQLNMPCVYSAPEVIFHGHLTPAIDVWALGVFIHMVFSGYPPFGVYDGNRDDVLLEMVLALGKLPDRWWTKWEDRSKHFDENGTFIRDKKRLPAVAWKLLKISSDRMEEEELKELESVMRKMVSYEAVDRISAAEVVRLTPKSWMMSG